MRGWVAQLPILLPGLLSPRNPALPARTIPRSGSFRGHELVRKDPDRAEMCIVSTSADPDCPSYMNVREHIKIFIFIS
jgi:hypothetical protein